MSRSNAQRPPRAADHGLQPNTGPASNRRSVLRALGALGLLGTGALFGWRRTPRDLTEPRRGSADVQLADNGMMDGANMGQSMQMFARHNEIHRTVQHIPGGVCVTTESNSPDSRAAWPPPL